MQELNLIDNKVSNYYFNWLFYEILIGANIISDDPDSKQYFIENQIVYNNYYATEATPDNRYKYNRIHDMEILVHGNPKAHLIKESCLNDLKDTDNETKQIKSQIESNSTQLESRLAKLPSSRLETLVGGRRKTRRTRRYKKNQKGQKIQKTLKNNSKINLKLLYIISIYGNIPGDFKR